MWNLHHNLASLPGQLALVTVGTVQGRPLSHSSGVKSTIFQHTQPLLAEGKTGSLETEARGMRTTLEIH